MERMTLNETIANLSSLYEELNNRWLNDTCSVSVYQVSRQKEYRDSYEKLKSTNIESLALRVITDSVNETVLGRLRNLIAENIRIYETRQDDFNQFDFDPRSLINSIRFGKDFTDHRKNLRGKKYNFIFARKKDICKKTVIVYCYHRVC